MGLDLRAYESTLLKGLSVVMIFPRPRDPSSFPSFGLFLRCVEFLCPTTQIPTNDPRFSSKSSSIIFHILQDKAQGMGKFQHAAGDWPPRHALEWQPSRLMMDIEDKSGLAYTPDTNRTPQSHEECMLNHEPHTAL